jgi:hypothetical protein
MAASGPNNPISQTLSPIIERGCDVASYQETFSSSARQTIPKA